MICVFEHKPGPGGSSLGGGAPSVENWRTRAVLRYHSNNVVDLGWSPDDTRLASASLDNTVVVWDATTWQRSRVLDFHTSFVKGLAWDPVGTYMATQVGGWAVGRGVGWLGWLAGLRVSPRAACCSPEVRCAAACESLVPAYQASCFPPGHLPRSLRTRAWLCGGATTGAWWAW